MDSSRGTGRGATGISVIINDQRLLVDQGGRGPGDIAGRRR
jgi:hypothetical protein